MTRREGKSQPKVTVSRMGAEGQPVVVIDNFVPDAERLRADAARFSFKPLGPYYPGIRAPADPNYLAPAGAILESVLRDVFGVAGGVAMVECNYSLVTTAPNDLQAIQRLPHFDTTDPGRIALLHYLCGPEHGGTRFYRHRSTGFETITAERFEPYRARLHKEAETGGVPPPRYYVGDTPQFEQIDAFEARQNRALVYRGITLHSGFIPEDMVFSGDPTEGRLTVNTFLQVRS